MSKRKVVNVAASVRGRLLRIIRETGEDPNLMWSRYATERLLYRLSVSEHANDFVLKGALLFMVRTGRSYRPTVDVDLLGYGEGSADRLLQVFQELCCLDAEPDGLVFDPDAVSVAPIREDQAYQGQRVTLTASLGKAQIHVQVDIGFGDVVTPEAEEVAYPTLLDFPGPRIRAYPFETVIAEKLQAMVVLGIANSRMKDFYDLYVLARDFAFEGPSLTRAITATFDRRRTDIPAKTPMALTDEFARDETKAIQWTAFVQKSGLEADAPDLPGAVLLLHEFLLTPLEAAAGQRSSPGRWAAGGPWHP
ncbi:MAG: hypothetical protein AMK72_07310 [Planctomycetes bacterium SM23_25]|nr:MAG: hypothetical protein AMK72_07310 [Planctomycetes bacterium SM23_25]